MAVDLADYSQAVNVVGGSVSISGTATVTISGTPTVSISGTPSVNIANTPSVVISSGTVSIGNTPSINIQSQSVTVNVNQPMSALADLVFTVDATKTTGAVPAGTHALLLGLSAGGVQTGSVTVTGHTTGLIYFPDDNRVTSGFAYVGDFLVFVVDSSHDTSYDVAIIGVPGGGMTLKVAAILDTAAVTVSTRPTEPLYVINPLNVAVTVQGQGVAGGRGASSVALVTADAVYDVVGNSAPANGSNASVVLAATLGKAYTATDLDASLNQNSATASVQDATLKDGANVIWDQILGAPTAVGNGSHLEKQGAAYRGTVGNSMTFAFVSSSASTWERVNIGAYLA